MVVLVGVTLNLKYYFTFSDSETGEERRLDCLLPYFFSGLVGNFSTPSNVDGEDVSQTLSFVVDVVITLVCVRNN